MIYEQCSLCLQCILNIMGTRDRKEREKENLRKLILKAAREIFFEKGYEQTSIRNIADRIEYSPSTLYLYYKDKDSIFVALQEEGFKLFGDQMNVLIQAIRDPFERLKAIGWAYMNFAAEFPDYYDLMFIIRAPMKVLEEGECWMDGESSFNMLVQVVRDCQAHGRFKGQEPEELGYVIWSTMHGMMSIAIRGRDRVISEEKRKNIGKLGYEAFVQMLSCI